MHSPHICPCSVVTPADVFCCVSLSSTGCWRPSTPTPSRPPCRPTRRAQQQQPLSWLLTSTRAATSPRSPASTRWACWNGCSWSICCAPFAHASVGIVAACVLCFCVRDEQIVHVCWACWPRSRRPILCGPACFGIVVCIVCCDPPLCMTG
jgi:hypothetical protein